MPLVDEETKQILLKKTWCHGQLVLPVFSLLYLWLYFARDYAKSVYLLYAALVLPCWSYVSYRAVFYNFRYYSFTTLVTGAVLVELAHAGVMVAMSANQPETNALNLMLLIASGLLFVETAAFLLVVSTCRPTDDSNQQVYPRESTSLGTADTVLEKEFHSKL